MVEDVKTDWGGSLRSGAGRATRPRRRANGPLPAGAGIPLANLIDAFLEAAGDGAALDRYGRPFDREAVSELRWYLKGHVAEQLGELDMDELRREDVEALVYELGAAGLARPHLRALVRSVRALYDYAIELRLLASNPAERVALPDEDERAQPRRGRAPRAAPPPRPGTTVDRWISLALQLATVALALLALLLILASL